MFCARLFICASWSPAGKGLTSWLSFVVSSVSLSLSHWYPGSGVVLDCIDSWSLQPYLHSCKPNIYVTWSTFKLRVRLAPWSWIKPSSKFFTDCSKAVLLLWIICLFVSCVSHAFASVHCCLVITCLERTGLLALVVDVYCIFCYFPMWYPGSGVVLDCIVSWSLPSLLLP